MKKRILNLPNKLTIFRVCLIPFFLILYLYDRVYLWDNGICALMVFIIASITDGIDGYIARKRNLVTEFGKLMDPLADKLLVCSALVAMSSKGVIPAWVSILIISREFIITGLRQLAVERGIVLSASIWGKVKTIFHMSMIIFLTINWPEMFFYKYIPDIFFDVIKWFLIYSAAVLTIISAADYIIKNKRFMDEGQ